MQPQLSAAMSSLTMSLPTVISSRTISTPLSQPSTSPSTAKSSIFSSADSILSTSPASSLPCATVKRKHGREMQETKPGPKRRRVMGRPKNAWTPTRLRKLVRLYLMTNLEVMQIAKVLQTQDFHPGKRDIQKQLETLLQPRPNQIRLGAHITKARLRVLRDCRELRKSQRLTRPQWPKLTPQNQIDNGDNDTRKDLQESMLIPSDDFGDDWSWLDLGLGPSHEAAVQSLDQFASQKLTIPQEGLLQGLVVDTASANLSSEIEALSPFEEIQTLKLNDVHSFNFNVQERNPREGSKKSRFLNASSTSHPYHDSEAYTAEEISTILSQHTMIDERVLSGCGIQCIEPCLALSGPPVLPTFVESVTPRFDTPGFLIEDYDSNQTKPKSGPSNTEFISASDECPMIDNAMLGERPETTGRLPVGGRPSRASVPSIISLNRRLSSKCSQSCLEDIVSLMDRHTISGSSASSSSGRTSQVSSKQSLRSFLRQSEIGRSLSAMDEPPILPVKVKPPVVLPGAFHVYCVAQLNRNKLRLCRQDGLPCEHASIATRRFFTSHIASKVVIYNRIRSQDINEIDQFGNTILHVAASFCAPIPYLIRLIKLKANINATNAAGETFLHLLYAPDEEDDVCSLLEILSIKHFNFGQHDQHGQTSLHLVTRPWLPQHYLIKVFRKIHSLGFVLPTSRDNLGFTLLRQMKHLGTQAVGFDPGQELAFRLSLGLTCETQGYIVCSRNPAPSINSTVNGNEYLHYYEKQNFVHNLDDLRRYEHHADLLRTIIKAGDEPWAEDSKGRNGLHCLAEVAFDLPLPNSSAAQPPSRQDEEAGNVNTLRESYLDSLLTAGVNPNNHDKKGDTPLMAFIINTRAGEDDESINRILTRLCARKSGIAKADIHRRNRRGETALHLAVKLGRLAVTKFLLRKGANVHSRNKKGSGVLKIGTEACKKASYAETLYAQIMLCMSLAMSAGAVSSPTIAEEWCLERASESNRI